MAALSAAIGFALILGLSSRARTQGTLARLSPPIDATRMLVVGTTRPLGRTYAVLQPVDSRQWTPSGWGFSATLHGRSIDLWDRNGWIEDPSARPGEAEVGMGWRGRNLSLMAGYAEPEFGAAPAAYPRGMRSHGLLGVNITMHTH